MVKMKEKYVHQNWFVFINESNDLGNIQIEY